MSVACLSLSNLKQVMHMIRRQQGLTLIELVISIVVISIALTAILSVMNRTTASSADPMVRAQAVAIAEGYLEEILLQSYLDPDGSEAGENRATFDDVDDYHNLANNGCLVATAQCPLGSCPCDQNGNPNNNLPGYTISVSAVDDGSSLNGLANNRAKRVDVTVQDLGGATTVVISGYRSCYPDTGDPATSGCPTP